MIASPPTATPEPRSPADIGEDFSDLVLEELHVGVLVVDHDLVARHANAWLRARLPETLRDPIGRRLEDLVGAAERSRLTRAAKTCVAMGQAAVLSHYLNRAPLPLVEPDAEADAPFLFQQIMVRPLAVGDAHFCLIEVHDVSTEAGRERKLRRQAAELTRANIELDQLVHALSHDLKTPLDGVDMLAGWLEDEAEGLDDTSRERLALLKRRVERMGRLLENMARYHRADDLVGEPERIEVDALIAEALETAMAAPQSQVVHERSGHALVARRAPLSAILGHLLDNAVNRGDAPPNAITLSVGEKQGRLIFSIADDGPAVPPAHRERIFDPFAALERDAARGGVGMALAIAKKLVEREGGKLWLDDADEGVRLVFSLPKGDEREAVKD